MESESSFEINLSAKEDKKSDHNGATTARSKTLLKGGSATENNGITVGPFANEQTHSKYKSEKVEDECISPYALNTNQLPGQKLHQLKSVHKKEKEVENVGKNIDLRIRLTKSNRIYLQMKSSKFIINGDFKHETGQSASSSSDEIDEKENVKTNTVSIKRSTRRGKEDITSEKHSWILRESGVIRLTWDISVIFFAIYNSIMTPFVIAFNPSWQSDIFIVLVDWIINVFFIIDIGINFRTTYTNTKTGLEVWNPKKIAKHYVLGGKFIIDLLSSIPFDTVPIESISFLNVIGMLKIVRIVRISKIIRHLNVVTETKTVLKTLQLLFNLLLYIHLLA
jgi:hypothetical protein